MLFRLTGALFRLTEVLFRQHGSTGLGPCYPLYKELSDAWCSMSWAVYLVWVNDIYSLEVQLFSYVTTFFSSNKFAWLLDT